MRGREHGIPSYNKWRRFCGLEPVSSFEQLKEQILDENVRKALAANYPSPGGHKKIFLGTRVQQSFMNKLYRVLVLVSYCLPYFPY
jgi:hypothetical protein